MKTTHGYSTAEIEADRKGQKRKWIAGWMESHIEEHRTSDTGEINTTLLVEDWDRSCADGSVTLDSDHPAWEIAAEVSWKQET